MQRIDPSSRHIEHREGRIELVTENTETVAQQGESGFDVYYYKIGEQLFKVLPEAHDIIFSAIHYRIFYIRERSETYPRLLSIEPLEALKS